MIITLASDFGTADGYLGALKGVLLVRCPGVQLVDLSHELAPGDVAGASHLLGRAAPHFPAGTVHLAVVDPGVGTARRGLALEIDGQRFVGPDNGLFSAVLEAGRAIAAHALENVSLWAAQPSPVFHGRDVFAPVAAHLARGGALAAVGSALASDTLVRLRSPKPQEDPRERGTLRGEVVHVDRFGNLVSNLPAPAGDGAVRVEVAGQTLPLARTYGDVAPGALVALVGSSGRIEVAVRDGSAAAHLGARAGLVIILRAPRESA
ncbi:MAG TPA: SAM-dependent chlorinase/fluorinase [Myxococcota bacterium]|nr:SAM-dependent chlorinase/fluorinase [Myxococcota bacterium]